jgi:tRNA1(Val) A37 N6-methylase TrmN6
MAEPPPELEAQFADGLTIDRWLDGKLVLAQPKRGHRVGTDAVLLAAAVGAPEGRIVDVGAGVGAVGLGLASRRSEPSVDLVEIDSDLARIAALNVERNGLRARVRVLTLDVLKSGERRRAGLLDESANCVVTNPPFFEARTVRVSPVESKARAHAFPPTTSLGDWMQASLAILAPGGLFAMIHRPDALATVLAVAENRLGALAVVPVHPTSGRPAHRLIVAGVKGSRAPLRVTAGLVLHGPKGRLTPEADAIHRGERCIDWHS